MEHLLNSIPSATLIIGGLAFLVSLLTEISKNLSFLKRIPTDLQVIVLSIVLTLLAFFAYSDYSGLVLCWWMPLGALLMGCMVSFVALYGWATFYDLLQRFQVEEDADDRD